jgi:hypothetical protein
MLNKMSEARGQGLVVWTGAAVLGAIDFADEGSISFERW